MKRRILTTSIPSWSQNSGADTFSTLLGGYGAENVANIYIRSDAPDSASCGHYFQIIESNVIKSVFKPSVVTGREVDANIEQSLPCADHLEKQEKKLYSFFTKHRLRLFLWMRELMWRLGKWNSKELNAFISYFNPDVFVFSIESYPHYNRLNNYIIDTFKPKKVIGFLWDDNFTYKQEPYNPLAIIDRFFLRKSVSELVAKCDEVLAICPKMKQECDMEFNVNSIVVTKPSREIVAKPYKRNPEAVIRLVYTGSLVIGRYEPIRMLAEAIKEINDELGMRFFLDIYSQTALSKKKLTSLNIDGSSCFHGSIKQADAFIEQQNSDILVFVESLKNKCTNIARLSFSTKITDYLSAGRCIFAIGPDDLSSVEYFQQEKAAIVATKADEIKSSLLSILSDDKLIESYAARASHVAEKNHNTDKIKSIFWEIINS